MFAHTFEYYNIVTTSGGTVQAELDLISINWIRSIIPLHYVTHIRAVGRTYTLVIVTYGKFEKLLETSRVVWTSLEVLVVICAPNILEAISRTY